MLPNVPEALIGLLATASIGAMWTISSPDLSPAATLDRVRQLEPTVFIGSDGYRFNGKEFDQLEHMEDVLAGLPTVEHVIIVRTLDPSANLTAYRLAFDEMTARTVAPSYERLPFDHPCGCSSPLARPASPKASSTATGACSSRRAKVRV
ncbi:hypothetical protein [Nesterenkonia pannonica]|uniref:hypothetical protein n=1 Tax=Nesterenkonia pannonica TaxID=1548602 RepID=UPI002164289D|nr:hypothetical protein [Nesterenkonia pannonica]